MKNVKSFEEFANESVEQTNEGIKSGAIKGFVKLALLVKGFKKLFTSEGRKEFFKGMKFAGIALDFVLFLKETTYLEEDILSDEEIKDIAVRLGVDKEYPTMIDIFQAEYEKKFKRKLKADLDLIYDNLTNPKEMGKVKEVKNVVAAKKMLEIIKEFRNVIK